MNNNKAESRDTENIPQGFVSQLHFQWQFWEKQLDVPVFVTVSNWFLQGDSVNRK